MKASEAVLVKLVLAGAVPEVSGLLVTVPPQNPIS